mgnify:CR=1 FL=1
MAHSTAMRSTMQSGFICPNTYQEVLGINEMFRLAERTVRVFKRIKPGRKLPMRL